MCSKYLSENRAYPTQDDHERSEEPGYQADGPANRQRNSFGMDGSGDFGNNVTEYQQDYSYHYRLDQDAVFFAQYAYSHQGLNERKAALAAAP